MRYHFGCPLFLALILLFPIAAVQSAVAVEKAAPNSDPTYQQLRNIGMSEESVAVSNFVLRRDAGVFTFRSGSFCFLSPVAGKVTGAVFAGEGSFSLAPPLNSEKHSLSLLTKEPSLSETFSHLTLRFTDATYDEIKKAAGGPAGRCDTRDLQDSQNALRHKLKYNLAGRILQDVLSPQPGGLFVAFIHGHKYSDKMVYMVDPHGAWDVAPEEVELRMFDDSKAGIWAAFHLAEEYASGQASSAQQNAVMHIQHQQLDTTIEKSGYLNGKAATQIAALANGVRVVPFDLFRSLRVQSASDEAGQALAFIQEDKDDDPQYFVILPKPLAAGDSYTIVTTYGGKEVVHNEGGGNYYPVARSEWYPNSSFGDYATYDMTFHIPKGMQMAASGLPLGDSNDGDYSVSHWRSAVPQAVAGFNFGRFKLAEAKLQKQDYLVVSYANQDAPDVVNSILRQANPSHAASGFGVPQQVDIPMGTMNTASLMRKALAEGQLAVELFTTYFGPLPYQRLAITQQTAFNYGQSWPGLVYLPISYFFDTTVRHNLGMDDPHGYFTVVAPHEVAHQWWGHEVGFHCYRDQWMSEGFADMSAALYLQSIEKNPQKFITFWNDERRLLLERNKEGFRAIDVGPVTMGYRLTGARTGLDVARRLIYPKGAYILHMIRMMMWDRQNGDRAFIELMHDFARTYANRPATTEDFKATVEKHMLPQMDVDGNGRMDWFFDQYVYGIQVPSYALSYSFSNGPEGDVVLQFKVSQSNVDDGFRMVVPLYLELADGRVVHLGRLRLSGNNSVAQQVPLKGLKDRPRRALLNYYDDVLATEN